MLCSCVRSWAESRAWDAPSALGLTSEIDSLLYTVAGHASQGSTEASVGGISHPPPTTPLHTYAELKLTAF